MLTSSSARKKQGGSQSLNDNSKGAAISAGAMLRRYGEQALRDVRPNPVYFSRVVFTLHFQDIRNLLREWSDEIDQCERVWIRASVSNRRIFFDYEDPVLIKGDERLRTFPFPTRRPVSTPACEPVCAEITYFFHPDTI